MMNWGGCETIIIGDFEGVVGSVRLELREVQVQCVQKEGIGEGNQFLAALSHLGEAISDHRQVKLKENQDVDIITEAAVLKINESGKIRDLYRSLYEIPAIAREKN